MSSPTLRKRILDAYKDRIDKLFGKNGSTGHWFRIVRRGFLQGDEKMHPACIVGDGGQRKVGEDESVVDLDLAINLTILMKEDWDRIGNVDTWTDRVQHIIDALDKHIGIKCGVIKMSYDDDDPADVILMDGSVRAAWQITFACTYCTDRAQT